jgi:hypothetical protein
MRKLEGEDYLIVENNLLSILADGYKIHPAYRAKVEPRCNCERCRYMWEVRKRLISLENTGCCEY